MKIRNLILAVALTASTLWAQTPTPNIGLQIPPTGSNNWNVPLNYNFNRLDLLLSGNIAIPALNITHNLTVGGTVTANAFSTGGGTNFASAVPAAQYSPVYYSGAGSSSTFSGVAPFTGPAWYRAGNVPIAGTGALLGTLWSSCGTGNPILTYTGACASSSGSSYFTGTPTVAVSGTPAASYVAVATNSTTAVMRQLTMDDILPGFSITGFSGGSAVEIGASVVNPAFTASYSSTPSSANITNTDSIDSPLTLTTPFTSGTVTGTFTHTTSTCVTFTLNAVGSSTQSATQQICYDPRTFGGVGTGGATGATASGTSAVLVGATGTLGNAGLNNQSSYGSFSPSSQKIYVLMIGNSHTFSSGGFAFPMNTPTAVTFVNANGSSVSMFLYESTNTLNGTFTLVVTSFMFFPFFRRYKNVLASLCLMTGVATAQVQLGGHVFVPSTSDSTNGQTNIVFTADADCTVATHTNCTVTAVSDSGNISGPYNGTLVVTSSVTLTATRNLILPAGGGRSFNVENLTTGSQDLIGKASSGTGVTVSSGLASNIFFDGTNYVVSGGGVNKIVAGIGINLSPTNGQGAVTVNANPVPETRVFYSDINKDVIIGAGASIDLLNVTGAGNVNEFDYDDLDTDLASHRDSVFIFTIDGGTPTSVPIALFCAQYGSDDAHGFIGSALASKYFTSSYNDMSGTQGFGCRRQVNIPYYTSIHIQYVNKSAYQSVNVYSNIGYYVGTAPPGHYPATQNYWHLTYMPYLGNYYNYNDPMTLLPTVTGPGQLASLVLAASGGPVSNCNTFQPVSAQWLEQTPLVNIDGVSNYGANGAEDFFGGSFYFSGGNVFTDANTGLLVQAQAPHVDEWGVTRLGCGQANTNFYTTMYREFANFPILFNTSLSLTWNAGCCSTFFSYPLNVGAAVEYWTQNPQATVTPTANGYVSTQAAVLDASYTAASLATGGNTSGAPFISWPAAAGGAPTIIASGNIGTPTYQSASTINSGPAVRLDGGSAITSPSITMNGNLGRTFWYVFNASSVTGHAGTMMAMSTFSSQIILNGGTFNPTFYVGAGTAGAPGIFPGAGITHVMKFNLNQPFSSVCMDGNGCVPIPPGNGNIGGFGTSPMYVGTDGGSNFLPADISDIELYSGLQTAAQAASTGASLCATYGVTCGTNWW